MLHILVDAKRTMVQLCPTCSVNMSEMFLQSTHYSTEPKLRCSVTGISRHIFCHVHHDKMQGKQLELGGKRHLTLQP